MSTRPPTAPTAGGNSTALDQWRGLALVFVLVSHGFYFTERVHGLGRVGVNLFFFISGVLVFKSLTGHRDASPRARAVHFWRRRLRRLYPALVAYLLAMIPIVFLLRDVPGAITASMHDYWRGLPFALVYAVNYWPPENAMSLGHLWSVACEMQFYLLAPLIFLLGGSTSRRRNVVWAGLLAGLALAGLVGGLFTTHNQFKYHFEIAVWPMMLGFFCEYRKDLFQRLPAKWFRTIILANVAAFIAMTVLMICGLEMKLPVIAIGTLAFVPCFLAYLGHRTLGGPAGRALTWLGERTYSIYLWQQPLTICNYLPALWHPAGALVSTFVGGLWFRWFEQPFLSAKRQAVTAEPLVPARKRRRPWIVGAIVIVAAVLAVFVLRHHYAGTLAAKVFPSAAYTFPPMTVTNPPDILLLGDSRAAAWHDDIGGRKVVNAGIGGMTSAQLASGCRDVLRQTKPRWVVVEIGVNDLKLLGLRPALKETIVSNCVANLATVVREAQAAGARVVVLPVWPAGPVSLPRRLVWSRTVDDAIAETNRRLPGAFAGNTNVVVLDLLGEMPASLYADTLHLTPAAYAGLSAALDEKLKALENGR